MSRHRFHGDSSRFSSVAELVADRFGSNVTFVADVAGGQGMLTRVLRKHFNYEAEVVDPRGWTLTGVPSRCEMFTVDMATYYDLIIGLHPDAALPAVVAAARLRPAVVVPCCNFLDRTRRLGRDELLEAVEDDLEGNGVTFDRYELPIDSPFNLAFVTRPPTGVVTAP